MVSKLFASSYGIAFVLWLVAAAGIDCGGTPAVIAVVALSAYLIIAFAAVYFSERKRTKK